MKNVLMLFLMAATSASAYSGQESGGGHVVACYSSPAKEKLESVQLYDLWEQKALNSKLKYLSFGDFPAAFAFIETALAGINSSAFPNAWYARKGVLADHAQDIFREISNAQEGREDQNKFIRLLDEGARLRPIPDLDNFIEPKDARCEIQAMANYRADGLLYISRELFEKLSPTDQAAFVLHETAYRYRRFQGEINSVFTRRLTALTMAGTPLVNTDQGFTALKGTSVLKCSSINTAKYVFYAIPNSDNGIQLQFERLLGFDQMNKTVAAVKNESHFAKEFFGKTSCSSECISGDSFQLTSSWTKVDGLPEYIYLEHALVGGVNTWNVVEKSGQRDAFACEMVPVIQ